MGRFDPYLGLYCQNGEVSSDVHTTAQSREGVVQHTPGHRSKLLLVTSSSCTQRGILNDTSFNGFAPDYD